MTSQEQPSHLARHPCLKHKRRTPFEARGRCHTVSHAFIYLEMLKRKKRKSFHLAGITGTDAQRRGETQDGRLCLLLDAGFQSGHLPSAWLVSLHFFFLLGMFFFCIPVFSTTEHPVSLSQDQVGPATPGFSWGAWWKPPVPLPPHPVTCEKPAHFFFESKSNKIPN